MDRPLRAERQGAALSLLGCFALLLGACDPDGRPPPTTDASTMEDLPAQEAAAPSDVADPAADPPPDRATSCAGERALSLPEQGTWHGTELVALLDLSHSGAAPQRFPVGRCGSLDRTVLLRWTSQREAWLAIRPWGSAEVVEVTCGPEGAVGRGCLEGERPGWIRVHPGTPVWLAAGQSVGQLTNAPVAVGFREVPVIAPGARCEAGSIACERDHRCVYGPDRERRCVHRPPCGAGLAPCPASFACLAGRCEPRGALGSICEAESCEPGLVCDRSHGDTGLCARPGSLGVPCDAAVPSACAPGLGCVRFPDTPRCGYARAVGETCDNAEEVCVPGSRCQRTVGAQARCVRDGALGGACYQGTVGTPRCDAGLSCYRGLCVPAPGLGASCASGLRCAVGGVCVGGVCEAAGAAGQRCDDGFAGSRCRPGLVCFAERCVGGLGLGETCGSVPCASGLQCAAGGRCAAAGALGARCRDAEPRCDEGASCIDGLCARLLGAGAYCGRPEERCEAPLLCLTGTCHTTAPLRCGPGWPPCPPSLRCLGGLCGLEGACVPGASADHARCGADRSCVGLGAPGCVADGQLGGVCRRAGALCDPGLACSFDFRCWTAAPLGGACDLPQVACADGSQCVDGRCRPLGSQGTSCRAEPWAPCREGLFCQLPFAICQPEVPAGAPCSPVSEPAECGVERVCLRPIGETELRCLPSGSRGGACRGGGRTCDAGLACRLGRCIDDVAAGDPCVEDACPEPLACVDDPGRAPRCRLLGSLGEPCWTGFPQCDDGLQCGNGRCRTPSPLGGPCDIDLPCVGSADCVGGVCRPRGSRGATCVGGACLDEADSCRGERCAPRVPVGGACAEGPCVLGALCVGGLCVGTGDDGGPCRVAEPRCREGLTCANNRCRAPLPPGAPCRGEQVCSVGSSCRGESEPRCAPDGSEGGACDLFGPRPCAEGLRCDGNLVCVR